MAYTILYACFKSCKNIINHQKMINFLKIKLNKLKFSKLLNLKNALNQGNFYLIIFIKL